MSSSLNADFSVRDFDVQDCSTLSRCSVSCPFKLSCAMASDIAAGGNGESANGVGQGI